MSKPTDCVECGTEFYPVRHQKICSIPCRRRRTIRRTSAMIQGLKRDRIFALNGGHCGICSEPIDHSLAWPHPLSACIDHINPVSNGGSNDDANLQPAHLACNSAKRDLIPS